MSMVFLADYLDFSTTRVDVLPFFICGSSFFKRSLKLVLELVAPATASTALGSCLESRLSSSFLL